MKQWGMATRFLLLVISAAVVVLISCSGGDDVITPPDDVTSLLGEWRLTSEVTEDTCFVEAPLPPSDVQVVRVRETLNGFAFDGNEEISWQWDGDFWVPNDDLHCRPDDGRLSCMVTGSRLVCEDFLEWTNEGCTTREGGTITLEASGNSVSGTVVASITHTPAGCEPLEPDCGWRTAITGSRCTNCFPEVCAGHNAMQAQSVDLGIFHRRKGGRLK